MNCFTVNLGDRNKSRLILVSRTGVVCERRFSTEGDVSDDELHREKENETLGIAA